MLSIEHARPTQKMILAHLNDFEKFCLGEISLSPTHFREINQELSISAVLMIGKLRYQTEGSDRYVYWRGLDDIEHNLGLANNAHIMRDYPGFNAQKSQSLAGNNIRESKIIKSPNGSGSISVVTMSDGSTGIGLDYRMAVRNAALKMHIKSRLNSFSLSSFWKNVTSKQAVGYA